MNPLVSVIIPTYNCSRYICAAVDSVLAQTYKNKEVIVVDDGSTDDTKEVLQRYGSEIRYHFQSNSGPSAARNTGIKLATGDMISFLDADDVWLPKKLELQVNLMNQHGDVGLVACSANMTDASGENVTESLIFKNYSNRQALLHDMMSMSLLLGTPNVLIKRECFDKVGLFDESLYGAEDWKMWMNIAKNYDIKFIEEPLVRVRNHANRISNDTELMKSCALKVASSDLYRGKYILSRKARSLIYGHAAVDYIALKNKRLAFINALKSIFSYPLIISRKDVKYRVLLSCVIPQRVIRLLKRGAR